MDVTPIASGKPFDAACASNIQEKPHSMSHALRNLTMINFEIRTLWFVAFGILFIPLQTLYFLFFNSKI